jgi:hypothetical protein
MLVLCAACASAPPAPPLSARPLPSDDKLVEYALDSFGRRLYAAAADGHPERVLLGREQLQSLLTAPAAARELGMRTRAPRHFSADASALFRAASYAAICIQNGWSEGANGPVGLLGQGFLFERALLVGAEPSGGPIASWVEGRFLHTDHGFEVLELTSIEAPRRDHADLELAVCELRAGEYPHKP